MLPPFRRFSMPAVWFRYSTSLVLGLTLGSNSTADCFNDRAFDGLWYQIGSDSPFTGFADAFHKNGKIRSRTKVKNGLSYGLIEEWDENGTKKGTLFKDEFR